MSARRELPIGVFDSGVGGLTVLRALRAALPHEDFIYLGDTARLPYGTKTRDSVLRYSMQAAGFLVRQGVKHLVIACNTASSVAAHELRVCMSPVPVIGVIEPGAEAACAASVSGHIAVLATEGTVQGGAYQQALAHLRKDVVVSARACTLFVALAEEGWTDGVVAQAAAHRYLDNLLAEDPHVDAVLLGCTHFPVLSGVLRQVLGERIAIVDSAQTTAAALAADLIKRDLGARRDRRGSLRLLATDGAERFARVGGRFLGQAVESAQVEIVDLAGARG